MNQSIIDYYFENLCNYNLNWTVFNEIIKLYNCKSFKEVPDLPIWKIFERTKDQLLSSSTTNPISAIEEIPLESYTYALGRNFICHILENCECDDETLLFSTLVDKIVDINNTSEKKLSLKAVLDLLSKIRWFFVRQDTFPEIWEKLTKEYPLIKITKQINFAFKSRTTNNKPSVNSNQVKLDMICYYGDKFKEFPPRSGLSYDEVIGRDSYMTVYTTTIKNPITIRFLIERKPQRKSPACIKIECLSKELELQGALVANFNIIFLDAEDNVISTKNHVWTFHNYFKLKLDHTEDECTDFRLQFCKLYFIENKKSEVIIAEPIEQID
jgi:hypothetical protein